MKNMQALAYAEEHGTCFLSRDVQEFWGDSRAGAQNCLRLLSNYGYLARCRVPGSQAYAYIITQKGRRRLAYMRAREAAFQQALAEQQ